MSRNPFEQLRSQFGIEERACDRRGWLRLCTAAEFRALVCGLDVNLRQFSARFNVGICYLRRCLRADADRGVMLQPKSHAKLLPIVQRARELSALSRDPGIFWGQGTVRRRRGSVHSMRRRVRQYRCMTCGEDLLRRQIAGLDTDEPRHLVEGKVCGSVAIEDRRVKKPPG